MHDVCTTLRLFIINMPDGDEDNLVSLGMSSGRIWLHLRWIGYGYIRGGSEYENPKDYIHFICRIRSESGKPVSAID